MPSSKKSDVFEIYMVNALEGNIVESKRTEDRTEKALQLFMGLFTGLIGVAVVVYLNVQDTFLKHLLIGIILAIVAGLGGLTFAWMVVSDIYRKEFAMERYHLFQYFHDLDPITFEKYGQNIYSLDIHRLHVFPDKSLDIVSLAISLSLVALMLLDIVTISAATYFVLMAFSLPNILISSVAGLLVFFILAAIWSVGQKRNRLAKLESQELIKKYEKKK
jgi:hypothetical protein